VLKVMQEHKLIQRRRRLERRKRPGFFRVERRRQLWQLDMTSIWIAEHGWTYLMAATAAPARSSPRTWSCAVSTP
jgi:hypothetical protein